MSRFCVRSSTALELHTALVIFRVQEGFDLSGIISEYDIQNPGGQGIDNKSFAKTDDSELAAAGESDIPYGTSPQTWIPINKNILIDTISFFKRKTKWFTRIGV